MPDYRPISKLAYCNEDHWRATVEVTDGANRREVQADIDLNATDGTANPRMTLPGGTVVDLSSNTAFVTAFRDLRVPANSREENQRVCSAPLSEVAPPASESRPTSWLWMGVPAAGAGLQYLFDRYGRHDMIRIPAPDGFGTLGTVTEVAYIGTSGLFVLSYVPIHRRWSPTTAWISDGLCLGAAAGFGIASGVQPRGEGTPELSMALTLGSTCGLAMVYGNYDTSRDPTRFWTGFGLQLGVSALGIGLGAGGVGRRPQVSGSDRYAPATLSPGARGVSGNPYESAQFPGIDRDLLYWGILNGVGVTVNVIDYLVNRSNPAERSTTVSVTPLPGGGALTLSGTF